MAKEKANKVKKPIFKKWWFWLIIAVVVISVFIPSDKEETQPETSAPTAQTESSAPATQTATSEATTEEESKDVIELKAGEKGEYGQEITMNEGTDMPEDLIVYYVPAGEYIVKNIGEYPTMVSVYSGFHRDESTGYDDYDEIGDTPRIEVNETAKISVPDGWFIEIHEPTHITLEPVK